MDNVSFLGPVLILGLILIQAVMTVAYAVLTNARVGVLHEQADEGDDRARRILAMIGSSNTTVTYYTVNALVKFLIAALAVLSIAQPLSAGGGVGTAILIYAGVLLLTASVVIVLGDTVPEAIGATYADRLVYGAGGLMNMLMVVFSPLVAVLLRVSKLLSSIAGSGDRVNMVTEEEIMTLIDAGHTGGTIEEEEKDMIYSVLQLDQTHVSEMMIPRIDVTAWLFSRAGVRGQPRHHPGLALRQGPAGAVV